MFSLILSFSLIFFNLYSLQSLFPGCTGNSELNRNLLRSVAFFVYLKKLDLIEMACCMNNFTENSATHAQTHIWVFIICVLAFTHPLWPHYLLELIIPFLHPPLHFPSLLTVPFYVFTLLWGGRDLDKQVAPFSGKIMTCVTFPCSRMI